MKKYLTLALILSVLLTGCTSANNQVNKKLTPTQVSKNLSLANGNYSVKAKQYYDFSFEITPSMKNVAVSGSFQASGGSGNDIQTIVIGDTDLINWSNGHPASAYYDSGKITIASFNVKLEPGKYHLVLNNMFSLLSEKTVNIKANLSWTQIEYH